MTDEQIDKARGCSCLRLIDKQIKEQHGDSADLQLAGYMLQDPKAANWEQYGDLPPLHYKYKEGKKVKKGHFNLRFCPFCGKQK